MNHFPATRFSACTLNSIILHCGGEALHPFARAVSCGIDEIDRAVIPKMFVGSFCARCAFSGARARGARAVMYVCGFAFASGAGAQVQSYPSKPIRMIVISSA